MWCDVASPLLLHKHFTYVTWRAARGAELVCLISNRLYTMSTKSCYHYNATYLVNYMRESRSFLQHVLHLSNYSLHSLHFHMCTSSFLQDVEKIFQLHPCMLHHSNLNCLHNRNYPIYKVWQDLEQGFCRHSP